MSRPVVVFLDVHDPPVRATIAAECPATLELHMATSVDPADRLPLVKDAAFFDNVANVARHAFRNIQRVLDGQPLPPADLVPTEP